MSTAQLAKDLLLRAINGGHKTLIAVSGGRLGATAANMPVVKLTTTGRVSGKPRTVMLTAPVQEDDRYILVASKGGDDRHPDWYRNLVANPQVVLEPVGGDALTLMARTATPVEKAALWPRIATSDDSGYGAYQTKTERDIPVVICEPPA